MIWYNTVPFVDNVDQMFGEGSLSRLFANMNTIHDLSYRARPCDPVLNERLSEIDGNGGGDLRIAWGGLIYREGMNQLTLLYIFNKAGSETLEIQINGVVAATISTNTSTTLTAVNIALSGYSVGDPIQWQVFKRGTTSSWGQYEIHRVYATGMTIGSTWGGVPTFTTGTSTTLNAARLNQLTAALNHCKDIITVNPRTPPMVLRYRPGWAKITPSAGGAVPLGGAMIGMWSGLRLFTEDGLRLKMEIRNDVNGSENVKLYFNGTLVDTFGPYGAGTITTIDNWYSFSAWASVGGRVSVELRQNVTSGSAKSQPITPRYTIYEMNVEPQTTYPAHGVSLPPSANTSWSANTLSTYLNAIATAVNNAYTRLTTTTALWGRYDATRGRWGDDTAAAKGKVQTWFPLTINRRQGYRLDVYGRNAMIVWGDAPPKQDNEGKYLYDTPEYQYNQALLGDKPEYKQVFFSDFDNLKTDQQCWIVGNTVAVTEHIW